MNATEPTRTSTPLSPSDPLSNRPTFTTMTTLRKALVPSLLATSLLAASTAAGASGLGEKVVIKAGALITMAGPTVEDGVIVMEGGRITAVGPAAEVEVPWDAEVIEAPELTAFPGFVEAHTNRGMDRTNETIDVAPFLNIRDSIDPVNFFYEDSIRHGVTTINVQQGSACVISGQGMVVMPHGMTVEQMLVKPSSGVVMSANPKSGKSQATQAAALRQAFADLRAHLEQLVQEKRDGDDRARREALYQGRDLEGERAKGRAMGGIAWKVDGLELVPRGEIEEKFEPLLDIMEGRLPVFFYCARPHQVGLALEVAKDNGFLARTTLVLGSSCWKAADEIAASGVPVVLRPPLTHVERDPVDGEEVETFVPGVFAAKGVSFALSAAGNSTQSQWFQAATAIGGGLSREAALAAVTTTPSAMLGLESRVGKLAPGFDANVVLFSGDPLSTSSFVERVLLGGHAVYDRSTDLRNMHIYEGTQPANTASPEEVEAQRAGGRARPHSDEGDDEKEGN